MAIIGLPALPPGHTSQVAWGFNSPSDGSLYEFFRVYRPPQELHGLGPICLLDQDLSHWLTILRSSEDAAEQHQLCHWISYGQARELAGPSLGFDRFSSPLLMRQETGGLLLKGGESGATRAAGLPKLVEHVLPAS
jgi:hypothetical protein